MDTETVVSVIMGGGNGQSSLPRCGAPRSISRAGRSWARSPLVRLLLIGRVDTVIRWTPDGRAVLVAGISDVPARVERLDVSSGRRELFKTLGPADLTGVLQIAPIAISDDAKSHAYSCRRMTSHLFLIGGAR